MQPEDRIIDGDVQFYKGEVEFCVDQLRRCATHKEEYWAKRLGAARRLLDELIAYRSTL